MNIKLYKNANIIISKVEIRLSDISPAKEFLKMNPNCKSQILSDNQVMFIYSIEQTQKITLLIKPVSMKLKNKPIKKLKKFSDLIYQSQQATGRKEAISIVHNLAILNAKFYSYEIK